MGIYDERKARDPQFLDKIYQRRQQRKYGVSPEVFTQMAEDQGGRCLICRKKRALCVDHDHSSGEVRGLLCQTCNSGLGFFKDNPILLKKAIDYLMEGG